VDGFAEGLKLSPRAPVGGSCFCHCGFPKTDFVPWPCLGQDIQSGAGYYCEYGIPGGDAASPVQHQQLFPAVDPAVARGEVVAHVSAAADLSDAQRTRLTEVLTRIYGHPVSLQLHINPELLGGLNIAVGDEVIDGTLSSKLAAAEMKLPD